MSTDGLPERREVSYAVGEHAERYRRIMRVFLLNKTRDIGWQLSPADVQRRLEAEFGQALPDDVLDRCLERLVDDGALQARADTRAVTSAVEWRRKRSVYDITPAGERVERLLAELDALGEEIGSLESGRLLSIRDALARIVDGLRAPAPDARRLADDLETVADAVKALRQGATDFIVRLQAFTSSDRITGDEFAEQQDVIVAYLQGFHRDLRRHADPIFASIGAVEELGAPRLVDLALSARDLPPAIGDATAEQIRAQFRRYEEARWQAVRAWFGTPGSTEAPWVLLTNKLLDAIRAIIDIAERLIDRAAGRRDRAAAWDALARIVATQDDAVATACVAVACGIRAPRHLSGPEADPDALASPGAVGWRDAPPIAVAAHLRAPGTRTPGAGTPSRLAGNTGLAERVRERQRTEQAQLAGLLDRLRSGVPVTMSSLHRLHPVELNHLLVLVSRAFAQRREPDGSRRASSPDGTLRLRLVPPADGARTTIDALHGRLECPDFRLEVEA
ncbi:TIGR02677 family protein [Patulibacter sp. NPDC049589]|uniref:TIGR02677 family protein n=1 Tax=Patulibacter sp. NPDC049589 TaxID=3154731 RepID=UPI00343AFE42